VGADRGARGACADGGCAAARATTALRRGASLVFWIGANGGMHSTFWDT
jgi:hypothetical protein